MVFIVVFILMQVYLLNLGAVCRFVRIMLAAVEVRTSYLLGQFSCDVIDCT